jgi:gliding motility-associated-like protein
VPLAQETPMTSRRNPATPFIISLCLFTGTVQAQLTTENTLAPEELVSTILVGQGVAVSNVMFNGVPATSINDQVAYFDGTNSDVGLVNGLVLATGKAEVVGGANTSYTYGMTGYTVPPDNPRNIADPDLSSVMGTTMQRCVAVLEFDFVPSGDSLKFRFVFGSEEYPEYVCSMFNDGFGFFLSGPGINGPFSSNAVNLAQVPGTAVPVAINTVNPGDPGAFGNAGTCAAADPAWQANSIYYVNNQPGASVELDGFTVPIMARAAVQCGQTYHIKMAIAHANDGQLDSAVLVEGGSFSASGSLLAEAIPPAGFSGITEGCLPATIAITRPDTTGDAVVNLGYAGQGITPGDLVAQPASITIPAGQSTVEFPIAALEDSVPEGLEQLIITASWTSPCGQVLSDTASLQLNDYTPMALAADNLYLACDRDSALATAAVTGGLGTVQIDWGAYGSGEDAYLPGQENGTYTVTAMDQCPRTVATAITVDAGCELYIPNVISPNNDGANDTWVISRRTPSGHSVQVFNRWGNEVYSSRNYANNWRAQDLPDGTYFYLVTEEKTGKTYKGHLTILARGRK